MNIADIEKYATEMFHACLREASASWRDGDGHLADHWWSKADGFQDILIYIGLEGERGVS